MRSSLWSGSATAVVLWMLAAGGQAHAASGDRYWVALGVFERLEGAQRERESAATVLADVLLLPQNTDEGFLYRVLQGPHSDRTEAEAAVRNAQSLGFGEAWLFIDRGELGAAPAPSPAAPRRLASPRAPAPVPRYAPSDPAPSEPAPPISVGQEALVEEAPEGFGLHRLRRDDLGAPGSSDNSRLRPLRDG